MERAAVLWYVVISQGGENNLPPYVMADVSTAYMPYEYGCTANIPGDIHVFKGNLYAGIKDMLDTFQNYTAELLHPTEPTGAEENNMER